MLRHKLDHRWLTSTDLSPEFYGLLLAEHFSEKPAALCADFMLQNKDVTLALLQASDREPTMTSG